MSGDPSYDDLTDYFGPVEDDPVADFEEDDGQQFLSNRDRAAIRKEREQIKRRRVQDDK